MCVPMNASLIKYNLAFHKIYYNLAFHKYKSEGQERKKPKVNQEDQFIDTSIQNTRVGYVL